MSYKPIVTLRTTEGNDVGLRKALPQNYVDGSFRDLIEYMTDTVEDDLNPSYTPEEIEVANNMRRILNDSANANISVMYLNQDNRSSDPISLESRVGDYLPRMTKPLEIVRENGEREQCTGIDLELEVNQVGGYY